MFLASDPAPSSFNRDQESALAHCGLHSIALGETGLAMARGEILGVLEMNAQLQNVVVGLTLIAVIVIDGYLNLKKMREMGKI